MRIQRCIAAVLFFLSAATMQAQTVQVNLQNRTIEIAANSSIEVESDLVTITIGYHNYGPTHEVAYTENARTSAQILKAWTDAGFPQKSVSTNALNSHLTSEEDLKDMSPPDRKSRQYEVSQSWKIAAKIETAQKLIDVAIDAGANDVGDPEWGLTDPDAAESQAYSSALQKARTIADQMAKAFGAKTGALLYASNESRPSRFFTTLNTESVSIMEKRVRTTRPETKLLPQKIEKSGYVRAIFALE
jgi:uncharacterized protein YggE